MLVRNGMNQQCANDALTEFYKGNSDEQMNYNLWPSLYLALEPDIRTLGQMAAEGAAKQDVTPGRYTYMWADAVATSLFNKYAVPK
jgi:hypothetical protein